MNKDFLKKCFSIFLKVVLPFFILFVFFLFPINDLRSVISQKIAEQTNNQVSLEFSQLNLNILPKPSLELEGVSLSTPQFSAIKMASLQISPSILGLISFKPGVSLYGEGVLGGNLDMSFRSGGKNDKNQSQQIVQIYAKNISLNELLAFLKMGIKAGGDVQLSLDSTLDAGGQDSEASVKLDSREIKLPENTIPTQLGAVTLPPAQISVLQVEGQLKNNKFTITKGSIGKDGDTVTGSIDGSIDMRVMAGPQGPQVIPTGYDLTVRIRVLNSFMDAFALKAVLESFQSSRSDRETSFNLGLSATSLRGTPSITKIQ
jgi:type II secretion system protein N